MQTSLNSGVRFETPISGSFMTRDDDATLVTKQLSWFKEMFLST